MTHNPIFAIMERADALTAAGADVISLAAGEPDAPTPAFIVQAAVDAVRDPANHHYGSAAGLPSLRAAVAARIAGHTGLTWTAGDVQVTLGAKQALFLALSAVLGPGDQVIVSTPGYPGHRAVVEAAGGQVRFAAVGAAAGYRVTVAALESAWTPQVRVVIIANPGNPTGATYSAGEWREIAGWLESRDVWLITDDVYSGFVYDAPYVTALAAAPALRARCIVVDSVSKTYAMTGWRVGWLGGPPAVIEAANRVISATATHIPLINQVAALHALRDGDAALASLRRAYRSRRDRTCQALDGIGGVDCPPPGGGLFVFPSVTGVLSRRGYGSTTDLARDLLEQHSIAVAPGEMFAAPGHLRICYAIDDARLDRALDRMRSAFQLDPVR